MKRAGLVLALFALLAGIASAQSGASPLEGSWQYSDGGDSYELVFTGNIILLGGDDALEWEAYLFSLSGNTLSFNGDYYRFSISNSKLTIFTDGDGDNLVLTKTSSGSGGLSPFEGMWRTGDSAITFIFKGKFLINLDEEGAFVFSYTNNTMTIGEDAINYALRGNVLTISLDEESIVFTRVN
jgi:hypothetical protein